jgi:hypothetical protein
MGTNASEISIMRVAAMNGDPHKRPAEVKIAVRGLTMYQSRYSYGGYSDTLIEVDLHFATTLPTSEIGQKY